VSCKAILAILEKGKIYFHCLDSNLRSSSPQPVHNTKYTIPAPGSLCSPKYSTEIMVVGDVMTHILADRLPHNVDISNK